MVKKTIYGFPGPNDIDFPGENRSFLPNTVHSVYKISRAGIIISPNHYIPPFSIEDYQKFKGIKIGENEVEIADQSDLLISLKYPQEYLMKYIRSGSVLFTMAHFHTRPNRVRYFLNNELRVISMDSVRDDRGARMVENLKEVAWNGFDVLFDYLEKNTDKYNLLTKEEINVLILGSGAIGRHAADSAIHLGNRKRANKYSQIMVKVLIIGKSVTSNQQQLNTLLKKTDILVDATDRPDPKIPIIGNEGLANLPKQSIILDLSADSYDPFDSAVGRSMVKAIEGTPTGDENCYIFEPADPSYTKSIPHDISSGIKRLCISHSSWPSRNPLRSMEVYGNQLCLLMSALNSISTNPQEAYEELTLGASNPIIRALYRGTLKHYLSFN